MKRAAPGHSGTVLVVDDEPLIVNFITKVLSRGGHFVITATNGAEAMEALKQHAVDVLISDLCMPGISGVELLAAARREFPDVVRIAFSGANDLCLAVKCVNDGEVYRYLSKPCGAEEILEAVDAALGLRDRQDAPEAPHATPIPTPVASRVRRTYVLSESRIRQLHSLIRDTELEPLSAFLTPGAGAGEQIETAELARNRDPAAK